MKKNLITLFFLLTVIAGYSQSYSLYSASMDELKEQFEDVQEQGLVVDGLVLLHGFENFESITEVMNVNDIRKLKIYSKRIQDIQFLRDFVGLEVLEIDHRIGMLNLDLLPKSLRYLRISNRPNQICGDQYLTNLKNLILEGNWDCEEVAQLTKHGAVDSLTLNSMDFNKFNCFDKPLNVSVFKTINSKFTNLELFSDFLILSSLKELEIFSANMEKSIIISSVFKGLIKLTIVNSHLKSLSGLENLSKLNYLDLSINKLKSWEANLPGLKYLVLAENKFRSVDLSDMDSLIVLDVSFNRLKNISGLGNFNKEMRAFYFAGNPSFTLTNNCFFEKLRTVSYAPQSLKLNADFRNLILVYDFSRNSGANSEQLINTDWENITVIEAKFYRWRRIENYNEFGQIINY
tara:strand:- start:2071 stop:3285 length:1215 start_codon:yes stop_codon:yes gene_type:complete